MKVVFHCKVCTEKAGKVYSGEVHILKPASCNVSIDLNVAELSTKDIVEGIEPLLTPPKQHLVDYSLSSTEESFVVSDVPPSDYSSVMESPEVRYIHIKEKCYFDL